MKPNHSIPILGSDLTEFILVAQPEMMGKPGERPSNATIDLAKKLIDEEVNRELLPRLDAIKATGYSKELMAELFDDCIDSLYVITWTMVCMQLPLHAGWNEVHKANMAKFPLCSICKGTGVKIDSVGDECGWNMIDTTNPPGIKYNCSHGRIVGRNVETGKVVKPAGWTKPDMWGVLNEVWETYHARIHPEVLSTSKVREEFHGDIAKEVRPGQGYKKPEEKA